MTSEWGWALNLDWQTVEKKQTKQTQSAFKSAKLPISVSGETVILSTANNSLSHIQRSVSPHLTCTCTHTRAHIDAHTNTHISYNLTSQTTSWLDIFPGRSASGPTDRQGMKYALQWCDRTHGGISCYKYIIHLSCIFHPSGRMAVSHTRALRLAP